MKIIQIALLLVALASIGSTLYSNIPNLPFVWKVWSQFTLKMLIETIFLMVLVIGSYVLINYYLPFVSWGWMNLIYSNGGNMFVTPLLLVVSGTKDYLAQATLTLVMVIFIVILPFITHFEEKIFRKGYLGTKEIIRQSIFFGAIHLLVGVPLSIAILLSFVGIFFASKYVEGYAKAKKLFSADEAEEAGVMYSTAYHTMYNTLAFITVIIAIWL